MMRKNLLPLCFALACSYADAAQSWARIAPDWLFQTTTDKMNDMPRGIARTQEPEGGGLVLKCDAVGDRSVYAQFFFSQFIGAGSSPYRPITYRADGRSPHTVSAIEDKSYALIMPGAGMDQLVDDIKDAKTLVVRATTFEDETVEMELKIAGVRAAIQKVSQACGRHAPM
jgi:hypothetical protein